ncbi:SUKH-4 family immunity protein [Streptomyces sp. NPDC052644]
MSTAVVVPAQALPRSLTHGPTRRRLSEEGLPGGHALMRFGPIAEGGVVPVAALLADGADPGELAPFLAELLVIGRLGSDHTTWKIAVDGACGRVFCLYLSPRSPGVSYAVPLAPSVDALARFLSRLDDFEASRGPFAVLAGRTGPEVVAEASALLMSAFTDEDWGEDGWGSAGGPSSWAHPVPTLWRIAALIRPTALLAGPGAGLRADLPAKVLEAEFGPDGMLRVDPGELPPALVHEPTRRFLTRVGLPTAEVMFCPWRDGAFLRPLTECEPDLEDDPELPADAGHLLALGSLIHDFEVVLDGRTGLVSYLPYGGGTTTPLNSDISTLAFTMWLCHRERRLDAEHDLTGDFYHELADTMTEVLEAVDPVACLPPADADDYRYWPEVFHDEAGDVL